MIRQNTSCLKQAKWEQANRSRQTGNILVPWQSTQSRSDIWVEIILLSMNLQGLIILPGVLRSQLLELPSHYHELLHPRICLQLNNEFLYIRYDFCSYSKCCEQSTSLYHKHGYNLKGISDVAWQVYYFWMRWESYLKAASILQPHKAQLFFSKACSIQLQTKIFFMTHEYQLATQLSSMYPLSGVIM